jgi:ribose 5-phosphate isomerase A
MTKSQISLDSAGEDRTMSLFQHIKQHFLGVRNQVIGLGSGKTVAAIVSQIGTLPNKQSFKCVVSSLQIKLEAERNKLNVVDENEATDIQILFDGADQLDSEYHMIKGGGGALFREKILFSVAKKTVILADSSKYSNKLNRSVPIEVHPFARKSFIRNIQDLNTGIIDCRLRQLQKGFPFFTENGNIIFDVSFESLSSPRKMVSEIRSIPGVIEVGIFPRPKNVIYYKLHQDKSYDVITFK